MKKVIVTPESITKDYLMDCSWVTTSISNSYSSKNTGHSELIKWILKSCVTACNNPTCLIAAVYLGYYSVLRFFLWKLKTLLILFPAIFSSYYFYYYFYYFWVKYNAFVNITQIGKRALKVTMDSKNYSKVVNFAHQVNEPKNNTFFMQKLLAVGFLTFLFAEFLSHQLLIQHNWLETQV